ncbi:MAG: NAD(+) synthase [Abditibacteriota bacterium]|nr:NAD(+) synthase [Abditibacteriota bacterium]
MKIAIVQSKPIAGDITGNLNKIKEYINRAKEDKAELIIFSNGSLTGVNIKGLLYDTTFTNEVAIKNIELINATEGINVLIPTITEYKGKLFEYQAFINKNGEVKLFPATPNDAHEMYEGDIETGKEECLLTIDNKKFSVNCPNGDVDLNIYSFMSVFDKVNYHNLDFVELMPETDVPYININSAGFCNGLVFTGGSLGVSQGKITFQAPYFEEGYFLINLEGKKITGEIHPEPKSKYEAVHKAIVNSIRDYINANGFKGIVFGMSGGVDSALVGTLAVEAIGPEKVTFLIMPSKYSSNETMSDAEIICNILKAKYYNIPIVDINKEFLTSLAPFLEGTKPDTTEENIQSRIRGVLNMAVSNKTGYCVLATGNKSEASTGYFTMYGDSCGSLAPIIDLYKTEVYELCEYINSVNPIIPESIIKRPPTAELAPGQKDNDSLPDYDILDDILIELVDLGCPVEEVMADGYDEETVIKVYNLLHKVEFKRCQYPLAISLSESCFQNKEFWDYPQTNKFRAEL